MGGGGVSTVMGCRAGKLINILHMAARASAGDTCLLERVSRTETSHWRHQILHPQLTRDIMFHGVYLPTSSVNRSRWICHAFQELEPLENDVDDFQAAMCPFKSWHFMQQMTQILWSQMRQDVIISENIKLYCAADDPAPAEQIRKPLLEQLKLENLDVKS